MIYAKSKKYAVSNVFRRRNIHEAQYAVEVGFEEVLPRRMDNAISSYWTSLPKYEPGLMIARKVLADLSSHCRLAANASDSTLRISYSNFMHASPSQRSGTTSQVKINIAQLRECGLTKPLSKYISSRIKTGNKFLHPYNSGPSTK